MLGDMVLSARQYCHGHQHCCLDHSGRLHAGVVFCTPSVWPPSLEVSTGIFCREIFNLNSIPTTKNTTFSYVSALPFELIDNNDPSVDH